MNYETKFKQDLIKKLKDKNLTDSSIKLYLRQLELLNDDQPLKNLAFLSNVENIINKLSNYKPNTKRIYLIAITSSLNVLDKPKLHKKYYDLMMEKSKEINQNKNEASETQKENWLSWEQVINKFNELKEKVSTIKSKEINQKDYNNLLQYLVLGLYTLQPPRRNADYQFMNIVPKEINDNSKNYLVLETEEFKFNIYKTSKKYGEQIEKINPELMNIIKLYIKYHPLIKNKISKNLNVPFLVYYDGKPFDKVNSITRILNSAFGQSIGSSMLRHIFLTDKYGKVLEEQKRDSMAMAHSTSQQKDYIKEIEL